MPAWCWSRSRAPIPPGSPTSSRAMPPLDAVIVSLQNGVGNVAVLRERLPGRRVLAGMVPFNVVARGEGRFHRATSGDIVLERGRRRHRRAAFGAGPDRCARPATSPACNGASCWSISTTRSTRWPTCRCASNSRSDPGAGCSPTRWRRGWRRSGRRASSRCHRRRYPPSWTPHLLRLPDAVFDGLLGRTMKIDPEARSSMWEDLQRGRRTEIDYLQGVITGIADRHGLAGAAVAPHCCADQAGGSRRRGFAGADAGADPALRRYAGDHRMKQIYAALAGGSGARGRGVGSACRAADGDTIAGI